MRRYLMKHVLNILRIISSIIALCLLLGARPTDYSKLVATGEVAISTMESSQAKLAGILRPLIAMMNDGVESVSKEYWDTKISPALLQADKELSALPDMLVSVIPANYNVRSKDPKDEPWVSIYDLSYSIKYLDLKGQNTIFDSEYLVLITGAANYIQMYITCIYGRYDALDRDKKRLQTIIDDPEGFRRNRIETEQREKQEKAEKERKEEIEHKQNALRSSPIVPNSSLDNYHSPFSFVDIPLGLEFHNCIKQFKTKGFELEKKMTFKNYTRGFTPFAILEGNYANHPTRIRIYASSKSYRVYEVNIEIDRVLDEYEADELMNGIATAFALSHPNYTVEAKNASQSLSLTRSLTETGRLFNKLGIPSLGIILRDFSVCGDNSSYLGMISLDRVSPFSDLGYYISYELFDYKIARIAEDEAKE